MKKHIETKTVANELNISEATLYNWMKKYSISKNKGLISKADYEFLKKEFNKKLNSRANKINSLLTFIPKEYFNNNKVEIEKAEKLLLNLESFKLEEKLYLISVFMFFKKGMISSFKDGILAKKESFKHNNLYKELSNWNIDRKKLASSDKALALETYQLPLADDLLGAMYQSILSEGQKAKMGSYYTPLSEVKKIVKTYCNEDNFKVLDPCCGTGSFLITFSKKIKNPENIYGYDYDPIAVKLARLNIIDSYNNKDNYKINIYNHNSLLDKIDESFDLIFTNPPWGFMFNLEDQKQLKSLYPEILSGESFSYFIVACLKLLKPKGILSFILPESIVKIKTHKDIREEMLNKTVIKQIHFLGPIFNKVMSNVVRIDLIKDHPLKNKIKINNLGTEFTIPQNDFKKNMDYQFSIQKNTKDDDIINKVYSIPHFTLKNNASWALGIVTGDNGSFIKETKIDKSYDVIITGKDLAPFFFEPPYKYIKFDKDAFQQCAPEEKFKAPEKLVYKFISKKLVFVLDEKQHYTLNSANILIPSLNYSNKVIVSLFNSKLYNFVFQKTFNSLKILKAEIEALPLPKFDQNVLDDIIGIYDKILARTSSISELDDYLYKTFSLSEADIKYIEENTK